ncbi:MAG: hypothetical protein ABI868_09945 [Acidobacteriota bacterium]
MIRSRWFAPVVIFLVCWTLTTHGKYSASGDEPHYLMVCQSLWADHDLDLANNYRDDDGRRFGAAGLVMDQHGRANRAGRIFPVHDIGVPVLLLPVYVAATAASGLASEPILARFRMTRGLFAYSLISICIIGLVTAAAAITRRALLAQETPAAPASTIVIALWLAPPVLSNSFLVFPEAFALLATALAVRAAFEEADRAVRGRVFWLAAALGLLPWLHRKYVFYAAALMLAVLWQHRHRVVSLDRRDRLHALVLFAAPLIGLAIWTWHYWGNLGGALVLDGAPFSWETFRVGLPGLIIDRENGLLVWAPVYLLLPAAWAVAGRRYAVWLLPAAYLFCISAGHDQWWGGFSPAARFLMPLVPIAAMIGAVALRQPLFRQASLLLLVPQFFISADGWQHTRSLWPQGDGHNRVLSELLGWLGANERWLPSLRTSPPAIGRALLIIAAVAMINLVVWLVVFTRHSRPEGLHSD